MNKSIPIYFDSVVIASPATPISGDKPELSRLKVGVFTKYGNRNGSYITDAIAESLISSAASGTTPVVGFFDPESSSWASHTGPLLASAYGYVEAFEGWQPFTDTDGVEREYAVFSVVLFNKYFKEANLVVGQHQSMELDRETIEGDWQEINGTEYFVYTRASIMGLCIIGEHEPCFSVSTFFAKEDANHANQYEKFSSLLSGLKEIVEEAESKVEGGEHPMENFENTLGTPAAEPVNEPAAEPVVEPVAEPEAPAAEPEAPVAEDPAPVEPVAEPAAEPAAEPVDFEATIAELRSINTELTSNYENAQNRIAELEQALADATAATETANARIGELEGVISTYEAEHTAIEAEKKNQLIDKYEKLIDEEEITKVREEVSNFSYSELESKLAISFANKQMANVGEPEGIIPQPEPSVNQFALLIEKYRKN